MMLKGYRQKPYGAGTVCKYITFENNRVPFDKFIIATAKCETWPSRPMITHVACTGGLCAIV